MIVERRWPPRMVSCLAVIMLVTVARAAEHVPPAAGAVAGRQASRPGTMAETRAVWIHAGLFAGERDPAMAKMRATLDAYRAAGITAVYCFDSLPDQHRKGWDLLGALITEAHSRRISVHPVLSPGYPVAFEGEVKEHPEWLIVGMKGEISRNLNLAHPGARRYILGRVSEALTREVDGIHLDYTRFPLGQSFSYDRETTEAFKKEFGASPLEVSHDSGSIVWCEWIRWNARQVTALVREIRTLVKQSNPRLTLSAAVFPNPTIAPVEIGQDWATWAREDLVDALCPMLYTNDVRLFREYVHAAAAIARGHAGLYAGIGCVSSHNKNTPAGVAMEVAIAREEGAGGFVLFSGYTLDDAFLAALPR